MRRLLRARSVLGGVGLCATLLLGGAGSTVFGLCGSFTDVSDAAFCPFVLEIFNLGITTGTTATTYDPAANVSRLQMAAFLSRTVDGVLKRGSRRSALNRFSIPKNGDVLDVTTVGSAAAYPVADGLDIWVPNSLDASVSRVRASDGSLLGTWSGASFASGSLSAMGKIFVVGSLAPGVLYRIDPRQPPSAVTTVASNLGGAPIRLAFDGASIWTANDQEGAGSVSIVTPGVSIPWTVTTVTAGFGALQGVLFDGTNVWVTSGPQALLRLDSSGTILQTVTVGTSPFYPVFDGANIWIPDEGADSLTVVRASNGTVLSTLTGNGMNHPWEAAFDGERVLVTNQFGDSVSLWKAADLSPIGTFPTGTSSNPLGACSDGVNFWITIRGNQLARF